MKGVFITIGSIVVMIAGFGIATLFLRHPINLSSPSAVSISPLVDQAALKKLPTKDASTADVSHVDSSIVPPTNAWLSGMVLQKTPLPVFPMPLSFLANETGFEIGLPTVTSTSTVIQGGHVAGINAVIDRAARFQLTRYDKVSATLSYRDDAHTMLGYATLAEGMPYVFYHPLVDGTVTLRGVASISGKNATDTYLRYTKNGHDYVVSTSGDSMISYQQATAVIHVKKDSLITFYALPDAGQDTLRADAGNELKGVDVAHAFTAQQSTTTLRYHTVNQKPTLFATLPYQAVVRPAKTAVSYDTIYGAMKMMRGNELVVGAPIIAAQNTLDISHLTAEHKNNLIEQLKKDAVTTTVTANDSYYAGKQLARLANLLDLSVQLRQTDTTNHLVQVLKSALVKRLDGTYFYYDTKLHGIAAQTPAFGSEDFNDHHFHYGYFIYAASVLARHDPTFVDQYQNKVNLLVADIAAYEMSPDFPLQRTYDPYVGHAWAAGLAPFADGNNQESSSEAMNAWSAVVSWGQAIKNDRLVTSGKWMLANEAQAARQAWRSPPTNVRGAETFTSPLTSLNFSAKRTYATFFSDAANAKLAIQLIPMSPTMLSLVGDGQLIDQQVGAAIAGDNYNVPLGDYILMYKSLRDPAKAVSLLPTQRDAFVDDGNSRTYLAAWIYVQADKQ